MSLRLAPALHETLAELDPDLRGAAHAIGMGLGGQLGRLRPALSHGADPAAAPDVEVLSLELASEGEPDGISLAAIEAAHQAYVAARGVPNGASLGAFAIARLLVWAQRAALLGAPPTIAWIGPVQRRPAEVAGIEIHASCVGMVDGTRHTAKALAVIEATPRGSAP
jgi:hypothetical protein